MSVESLSNLGKLATIVGLALANGFFVAAEFSLVSIRRSRVEELVAQGIGVARVVESAVNEIDRYIAGTQVGITLASLALGCFGEPALAHQLEPFFSSLPGRTSSVTVHGVATTIALLIITVLHVVLGELVPKSVALQMPEKTAMFVARPMVLAVTIFQPLIWLLNGLGNSLLRLLRLQAAGEHPSVHSVEELQILVRQSHEAGVLADVEREMLQRTFRFPNLTAGDVMIHRLDIVALDIGSDLEELLDTAAHTIHTRLPVYEGTIDNVIGVLHTHDLFKKMRQPDTEIDIRKLVRPPLIVPKTTNLDVLLENFRQHHTQIAIIISEHGGTEGLITLEDVIEEVFGEFEDMLEAEQPDIQETEEGRIVVRGNVHLNEIEWRLGWQLREEGVDTVAGYVISRLGRTARLGDVIDTPYGTIRVENMARIRITQVSLHPKTSPKDAE